MNAFQYYVIDSFIKHKNPTQSILCGAAPIEDDRHHPRLSLDYSSDASDSEDGSKGLLQPPTSRRVSRSIERKDIFSEEYNPEYDGGNSEHQGDSPQSGYFSKTSRNGGAVRKPPTVSSQRSRNSSMMLLPGSRGPSTPGYADEEMSIGRSSGGRMGYGDDDSTLVGG
jgi:hypothetical protein